LIRLTGIAATLTRSDWHPEPGDIVLPVDPRRPLFHYEHPFKPGELDGEAAAAGLRTAHHCDFATDRFVVLEPEQAHDVGRRDRSTC
jgi:hypothetical protein